MENVVPGMLQRLRASDIIRMAGLTVASLGQEYFRTATIQQTQRQGAHLSGTICVPHIEDVVTASPVRTVEKAFTAGSTHSSQYPVVVELQSTTTWKSSCLCSPDSTELCSHAAALLYQWLNRPSTFVVVTPPAELTAIDDDDIVASLPVQTPLEHHGAFESMMDMQLPRSLATKSTFSTRGPTPLTSIQDIVGQMGLSDMRNIAREYDIAFNGMNKQQLIDAILEILKQPEAVRRVATTLEKPQRQLLAALTLAGGSMTDDDLRGVFERFSLGQPSQLQPVLLALQSKGFLFRTSLNSSSQQRIGLSGALLDVGWFVPLEVRNALRVTVPVSTVDVEQSDEQSETPDLQLAEPYHILSDLLLVARALDGYQLEREDELDENTVMVGRRTTTRLASPLATDGSIALPMPDDMPSPSFLSKLQASTGRPPALLRFAWRLLRQTDILHKEDEHPATLHLLAQTTQLLLGPTRAEIARDLFELWLTQASYDDLFHLQEDGLRVRSRATSLSHPILRTGELEAENSEARQTLLSLLAQAPFNQWISFSSFARFVYRLQPTFLQKRQRLFSMPHWWIEYEEGRPLRPTQLNDWLHAEYYYLVRLLRGPLHWWGLCDIASTHDGRLFAFRLTPIAKWLLHAEGAIEAPTVHLSSSFMEQVVVTEASELLVPCTDDAWPLVQLLEMFAEPAGAQAGLLRYHLTAKALGNAMSKGLKPAPLVAALRELMHHSSQRQQAQQRLSLLVAQMERWTNSYGRVRLYTDVALLETADTVVMRELHATTSLEEQLLRSIHPTLHILKRPGAERLIEDLKRRGQTPLLHNEDYNGAE